jgi:AbrB family looped-hinge helix DNA binding protein
MKTTILSSKGQVIIPKAIRESHQWQPGTRFVIEESSTGVVLQAMSVFPVTDLRSGLGCACYVGPAKSMEEMREGVDCLVVEHPFFGILTADSDSDK